MGLRFTWDKPVERLIETGVSKVVLYPGDTGIGYSWSGVTSISENPSGAEPVDLYADGIKYCTLQSVENFEATIEAYNYPKEFAECDGSRHVADGVSVGQQKRKPFGLCYRTEIFGSVGKGSSNGYKLHLIYNATASPSEKDYSTLNDSADTTQFSWDIACTPVPVAGRRPTSSIVIDSTKVDAFRLEALEAILYGDDGSDPRLPEIIEVISMLKRFDVEKTLAEVFSIDGLWIWDTFNFVKDTVPIAIEREALRHVYFDPAPGTQFVAPTLAYTLLSEEASGKRTYSAILIDNDNPSRYYTELKNKISATNEDVVKNGNLYYYSCTFKV